MIKGLRDFLKLNKRSRPKAVDVRVQGQDGDLMINIGRFTDHRNDQIKLMCNPHFRIFDYMEDE